MDIETQTPPVLHAHGEQEHAHPDGHLEHEHEPEPARAASQPAYTPDPEVQAFVTTITIAVAHTNQTGPYDVVKNVTAALEGLELRGVVVGVAAVELRGDGGLIGL